VFWATVAFKGESRVMLSVRMLDGSVVLVVAGAMIAAGVAALAVSFTVIVGWPVLLGSPGLELPPVKVVALHV
jgi:hypothetical protein